MFFFCAISLKYGLVVLWVRILKGFGIYTYGMKVEVYPVLNMKSNKGKLRHRNLRDITESVWSGIV